jgi:hypothetical protein
MFESKLNYLIELVHTSHLLTRVIESSDSIVWISWQKCDIGRKTHQ